MPSEFALGLSEQLCRFFSIPASDEERLKFASAIDFHAKYLGETNKDDLASLLFLECVAEADKRKISDHKAIALQMGDLRTLLSRVQKRLYRGARTRSQTSGELIQSQPSKNPVDAIVVERVLSDFQTYVATVLSPRDGAIFDLRFIQGKTIQYICKEIGVEKSTVYERIRAIRDLFTTFLADVSYPGFS